MDSKPLVSIITIFFNAERFFEEAIESVFAQTYERWELLLVDDGSTDRSTQIARDYAARYPDKVRYLEHEGHQNRGMSASRNLGIYNARGEYITFLDADDILLPTKLDQQAAILEANPQAGMVCAATLYWHSWTGRPEDAQRDVIVTIDGPQDTIAQPPALLTRLYPLGEGAAPCVSALLIRRAVIKEVGGFEESFRGMYEDQAFLTKVYLRTPVFVASAYWDQYRQHPNSCSSVAEKMGQYEMIRLFFLNWLENYLIEQRATDTEAWTALQEALWPYRHPYLNRLHNWVNYKTTRIRMILAQVIG